MIEAQMNFLLNKIAQEVNAHAHTAGLLAAAQAKIAELEVVKAKADHATKDKQMDAVIDKMLADDQL